MVFKYNIKCKIIPYTKINAGKCNTSFKSIVIYRITVYSILIILFLSNYWYNIINNGNFIFLYHALMPKLFVPGAGLCIKMKKE